MSWYWIGLACLGYLATIVLAVVVTTSIQLRGSRRSEPYRAELDAPEYRGYGGQIRVQFETLGELLLFLDGWRSRIDRAEPSSTATEPDAREDQVS